MFKGSKQIIEEQLNDQLQKNVYIYCLINH